MKMLTTIIDVRDIVTNFHRHHLLRFNGNVAIVKIKIKIITIIKLVVVELMGMVIWIQVQFFL